MRSEAFHVEGVPTLKYQGVEKFRGLRLIDVRRPDEFDGELGHLPGAELKTLGDELEAFLRETSKAEAILFICRSGKRSATATSLALSLGFQEVYNMEGGMLAVRTVSPT